MRRVLAAARPEMDKGDDMTSPPSVIRDVAFRRQFVMGPKAFDLLPDWNRVQLRGDLTLSTHPDLPLIRAETGGRTVILLGFLLDPEHPDRSDQTILDTAVRDSATFDDVVRAFDPFAGRWAAIHLTESGTQLFHDPAGLRQIYHGRDDEGTLWCGSSPGLLSMATGRAPDVEHRDELIRAGILAPSVNHFWPGNGSAFIGIDRLLPNHYLDATTGQAHRYWPRSPIDTVAADEAVVRCAAMLTGVMSAAARYPLAMALTSGLDSRVLLAASRDVTQDMAYFTLKRPQMTAFNSDIRVVRRMLRDLGLRHTLIDVGYQSDHPIALTIKATFHPHHQGTADWPRHCSSTLPALTGNG